MIKELKSITETELDQIMKIWLSCNVDTHSFISKKYWVNNYDHVRSVLPSAELLGCYENDVIVGFLGLKGNYIAGIFINKNLRSLGLGKKLLDTAKKKRSVLELSVYEKNKGAVNFYLRNGFLVTKDNNIDTSTGEQEYQMKWEK